MSSSPTKLKNTSDSTVLKRNQFSVKTNSSKSGTLDKSYDSDHSKETKTDHQSNPDTSVDTNTPEKVLKASRTQVFRDFAGVTILMKAAMSSKHTSHEDVHEKSSIRHNERKSEIQSTQEDI
ncbi:hypothetical protein I4U23_006842 [Adineta vaga]|nr:hypothetical protein I4U23_006842 [Adineta vaga]